MKFLHWVLVIGCAFPVANAAEIPVRDFARLPEYQNVEISPDGKYLAVGAPIDERTGLSVIRLSDMKVTAAVTFGKHEQVYQFWWVGPERVVVSIATTTGSLAQPFLTGELVSVNADGSKQAYLIGYRAPGTHEGVSRGGPWAFMIDPLPDDAKHALVAITEADAPATASLIDVYNGRRQDITASPIKGGADFVADVSHQIRYVTGVKDYKIQTFSRGSNREPWKPLDTGALKAHEVEAIEFSLDGKTVYLSSDEGGDRRCLVEHRLDVNERRQLACDPDADLDSVFFASDGHTPLAAVFAAGAPKLSLLKTDHPERARLIAIARSFPGQFVSPVSETPDGRLQVWHVRSDRNPGEYYLYERDSGKVSYLLSERGWIKADQMGERRPIEYKARDGTTIFGYLTIPAGRDPKKLPMVVIPHGGPLGPRDEWFWDADSQFLASRGFLTLQVNFRGSGGYGYEHGEKAKRNWGTTLIDDIVDGTRWAVTEGYADGNRLCIYGGSYGGYAALMSATREPDLFKCAVGYSGVYDLAHLEDSDIEPDFIEGHIGKDRATLASQSPINQLGALKAALFIVHGEGDRRAPYTQATRLREALEARKYPYQWLTKAEEGHGFWKEANRIELYERLQSFIYGSIGAPPAK